MTVTFVALLFWGWVMGALGALLAIPLTLLVKALLVDVDPRGHWLDALLARGAPGAADDRAPAAGCTPGGRRWRRSGRLHVPRRRRHGADAPDRRRVPAVATMSARSGRRRASR